VTPYRSVAVAFAPGSQQGTGDVETVGIHGGVQSRQAVHSRGVDVAALLDQGSHLGEITPLNGINEGDHSRPPKPRQEAEPVRPVSTSKRRRLRHSSAYPASLHLLHRPASVGIRSDSVRPIAPTRI
jgi:hypothetical protein